MVRPRRRPPFGFVRPKQHGVRQSEVAVGEALTDARAADGLVAQADRGYEPHAEAFGRTVGDEGLAVAGPSASVLEVGTDMERLQVREGLLQPLREVRRFDARMVAVEFLVMDQLRTGFGQSFILLRAREDQRDGGFRPQHLARVRIVSEHADDASVRAGGVAGGVQDGAMAEVHAVEGADGEMEGQAHAAGAASLTGTRAATSWSSLIAPSCGRVWPRERSS